MDSVLLVLSRMWWILLGGISAVLTWKTIEYFNNLPENAKSKPLLAWDGLMLLSVFVFSLINLLIA